MEDDEGERQFMDAAGKLEKMYKERAETLGDNELRNSVLYDSGIETAIVTHYIMGATLLVRL